MTDPESITINVGGVLHTTSRSVLTKYPDSMLGAMFNGAMKPSTLSKDGNIFIDRDGDLFSCVLEFLTSGKLSLPQSFNNPADIRSLVDEAEFYQIVPLLAQLRQQKIENCYSIDIFKLVTDSANCKFVIEGMTTALSKIPGEYLDMKTRLDLQDKNGKIIDTIKRITLECPSSFDKKKTEAVLSTFERSLQESGWRKSVYYPLPYFVYDAWHTKKNAVKERTTWFYE